MDVVLEIGSGGGVAAIAAHSPVQAMAQPHTQPAFAGGLAPAVSGHAVNQAARSAEVTSLRSVPSRVESARKIEVAGSLHHQHNLVEAYTFDNFIEGKSNQLALAAAKQVAQNPGDSYNPLFLYGGVGLGKTHLMHAVGNALQRENPGAKVVYLHSERFVADMVKALQLNAITDFKLPRRAYNTVIGYPCKDLICK